MPWRAVTASLLATLLSLLALLAFASIAPVAEAQQLEELEAQKLREEIRELELANDREDSVAGDLLAIAPFVTVLVGVAGLVLPLWKEARERRRQRQRELDQAKLEARRRFDQQFAAAVANLGADKVATQVSAAVSLKSFLTPEYKGFHDEVYSVVSASLTVEHPDMVIRFLVDVFEKAVRLRLDHHPDRALNLARCQLPRVDLSDLSLRGADLAFATLKNANLNGANLYRARGIRAMLAGARVSRATLDEVRFHKVRGAEAQFHGSRLISAEFRRADLRAAEFHQAKLQGAHFDRANLRGARFDQAELADTYFYDARFDDTALASLINAAGRSWRKAHFDSAIAERLEYLDEKRRRSTT
jgi:uncharacterized protein YjbI with pentapeptide repeats